MKNKEFHTRQHSRQNLKIEEKFETRKQAIDYVQEKMSKYSTEGRQLSKELIHERRGG